MASKKQPRRKLRVILKRGEPLHSELKPEAELDSDALQFECIRAQLANLRPRSLTLEFDEINWKWFVRTRFDDEHEENGNLEEISVHDACEWVDENCPSSDYPDELIFHADLGVPGLVRSPGETGLWEFDPRSGWHLLGGVLSDSYGYEFLFSNDTAAMAITGAGESRAVAHPLTLCQAIERFRAAGLNVPERLAHDFSLDTRMPDIANATSLDQINDPDADRAIGSTMQGTVCCGEASTFFAAPYGITGVQEQSPSTADEGDEISASSRLQDVGASRPEEGAADGEDSPPESAAPPDGAGEGAVESAASEKEDENAAPIRPERRTIPLSKRAALRLLGFRGRDTRPLTKAMANGAYRFIPISRQRFIFDLHDIAEEERWRATLGGKQNAAGGQPEQVQPDSKDH